MYWKGRTLLAEMGEIGDFINVTDVGGGAKGPAPVVLTPKAPAGPSTIMPPEFFDPLTGQFGPQAGTSTGVPGGQLPPVPAGFKPTAYQYVKPTAQELAIKKQLKDIEDLRKKKEALEAENKAAAEKHAKFLHDTNLITGDIAPPKDLPPREPYPGEDRLSRSQKDRLEAALRKEERDRARLEAERKVAEKAREEVRARGEAAEEWRRQKQIEAAAAFVEKRVKAYQDVNPYDTGASEQAYKELARLQIGRAVTGAKNGLEGIENKRAQELATKVADFLRDKVMGGAK